MNVHVLRKKLPKWFDPKTKYEVHITIMQIRFTESSKSTCKGSPLRKPCIPVLPAKINNKLLFSVCRTCSESQHHTPCFHSDIERSITGTWVTHELKMAVKKSRRFTKYDTSIMSNNTCTTQNRKWEGFSPNKYNRKLVDGLRGHGKIEDDKQKYIKDYCEKEGIGLDHRGLTRLHKIQKNPGLRALAKLMLNSFWGKFGQNWFTTSRIHIWPICIFRYADEWSPRNYRS